MSIFISWTFVYRAVKRSRVHCLRKKTLFLLLTESNEFFALFNNFDLSGIEWNESKYIWGVLPTLWKLQIYFVMTVHIDVKHFILLRVDHINGFRLHYKLRVHFNTKSSPKIILFEEQMYLLESRYKSVLFSHNDFIRFDAF